MYNKGTYINPIIGHKIQKRRKCLVNAYWRPCWIISTIHTAERAIARLKIFQILTFIRHDLYPYINKILVILAYTGK